MFIKHAEILLKDFVSMENNVLIKKFIFILNETFSAYKFRPFIVCTTNY